MCITNAKRCCRRLRGMDCHSPSNGLVAPPGPAVEVCMDEPYTYLRVGNNALSRGTTVGTFVREALTGQS
jgi:hypothetical protein